MPTRPSRITTERDLRAMSTEELLRIIEQDVRDLDRAWRDRPRAGPEAKAREQPASARSRPRAPGVRSGKAAPAPGRAQRSGQREFDSDRAETAAFEPDPQPAQFHRVVCCDNKLGDFPAAARVRCPFCEQWHRAGDFPRT